MDSESPSVKSACTSATSIRRRAVVFLPARSLSSSEASSARPSGRQRSLEVRRDSRRLSKETVRRSGERVSRRRKVYEMVKLSS